MSRMLWALLFSCAVFAFEKETITFRTNRSYSRITIALDASIKTQYKFDDKGFSITIPNMPLSAFETAAFDRMKDERLRSIKLSNYDSNLIIVGEWNFPDGKERLAYPKMETFDYRDYKKGLLVLDFWHRPSPTYTAAKIEIEKNRAQSALKTASERARSRMDRRIAAEKKAKEDVEATRYCQEPLKNETEIFLPFRPARKSIDITQYFSITSPDKDYPYIDAPESSEDGKILKLAIDLYRTEKHALVLKTVEFLERDHPQSSLVPQARFIKANTLLRLGFMDQANQLFEELSAYKKGSAEALNASIYLATKYYTEHNFLKSLDYFLRLENDFKEHRLNWVFHLAAAECLYEVNQLDRAYDELTWLEKNGPTIDIKANAAYKMGDLSLLRGDYSEALVKYYRALQQYPKQVLQYPEVEINRGEALYWLARYEEAKKIFTKLSNQYPTYPNNWRSTIRLAEIEGRKKGPGVNELYRQYLNDTINRFPFSSGAVLARLKLLPCGKGEKSDYMSAVEFLSNEAEQFDGKQEVLMDQYNDFLTLTHVRAAVLADQKLEASQLLVKKFESKLNPRTRVLLQSTFKAVFRDVILGLIKKDKPFDALAYYDRFSDKIPNDHLPMIPDYLLQLSMAASKLGLGTLGNMFFAQYEKVKKERTENKRSIASNDENDLDALLERSSEAFAEANAIWLIHGLSEVERVKKLLENIIDESPFSSQAKILLAKMADREGKTLDALALVASARLLNKNIESNSEIETIEWLANLYAKSGKWSTARELIRKVQESRPEDISLKFDEADWFEKDNQWKEASNIYSAIAASDTKNIRALFLLSRAELKSMPSAEIKTAALKRLEEIAKGGGGAEGKSDFWIKAAKEILENQGTLN